CRLANAIVRVARQIDEHFGDLLVFVSCEQFDDLEPIGIRTVECAGEKMRKGDVGINKVEGSERVMPDILVRIVEQPKKNLVSVWRCEPRKTVGELLADVLVRVV